MMNFPIWDVDTMYKMVGDDVPLQSRMLRLFLRDATKQVPAIVRAATLGKLAVAADLAHILKTSARIVGALRMGLLCEEIETAGDANEIEKCCAAAQLLEAVFSDAQVKIRTQTIIPIQS